MAKERRHKFPLFSLRCSPCAMPKPLGTSGERRRWRGWPNNVAANSSCPARECRLCDRPQCLTARKQQNHCITSSKTAQETPSCMDCCPKEASWPECKESQPSCWCWGRGGWLCAWRITLKAFNSCKATEDDSFQCRTRLNSIYPIYLFLLNSALVREIDAEGCNEVRTNILCLIKKGGIQCSKFTKFDCNYYSMNQLLHLFFQNWALMH